MIELEKIDSRCIECNRPMYWRNDIGAVHYTGYKKCPNTQSPHNKKEVDKHE